MEEFQETIKQSQDRKLEDIQSQIKQLREKNQTLRKELEENMRMLYRLKYIGVLFFVVATLLPLLLIVVICLASDN